MSYLALRKIHDDGKILKQEQEQIFMHVLSIRENVHVSILAETLINILDVAEIGLQYKITDYVIAFIIQTFKYDERFALQVQARIRCVYYNKFINNMLVKIVSKYTYMCMKEVSDEMILYYIKKIIRKNYQVTICLGISYFRNIVTFLTKNTDRKFLSILISLIKCRVNFESLYKTNYSIAKTYDELLTEFAENIPHELYLNIMTLIEDEEVLFDMLTLLKFNLIRKPSLASSSEVSMFLWEFLLDNFAERTYKLKEIIIQVLDCLTNDECFIDEEYLIFALNIIEIITEYLEISYNIFYTVDIIIHFVFFMNTKLDRKIEFIDVLADSDLYNIIKDIYEQNEELWINVYLENCINMIEEICEF